LRILPIVHGSRSGRGRMGQHQMERSALVAAPGVR